MDEVFVMSRIIKVEVSVISRTEGRGETLIIPDITETKCDNCFIIHCFEIDNDKYTVTRNRFDIALGIMHCARNLQITGSQLSAAS